jgi:hypothetical protein
MFGLLVYKFGKVYYQQFQDELDFSGIEFPVTIDKIGKFERQNNISVNVFGFEDVLLTIYITKEHFDIHVNFLLYTLNEPSVLGPVIEPHCCQNGAASVLNSRKKRMLNCILKITTNS